MEDPTSKIDGSTTRTYDILSKGGDVTPRADDAISKADDAIPKAGDAITKADDAISKADDAISKVDDAIPKADDVISKADDDAMSLADSDATSWLGTPTSDDAFEPPFIVLGDAASPRSPNEDVKSTAHLDHTITEAACSPNAAVPPSESLSRTEQAAESENLSGLDTAVEFTSKSKKPEASASVHSSTSVKPGKNASIHSTSVKPGKAASVHSTTSDKREKLFLSILQLQLSQEKLLLSILQLQLSQ
jgi:hypothetical protein